MDGAVKDLLGQLKRGDLSRREFIERGLALGLTTSALGLFLQNAAPALAAQSRGLAATPQRGGTLRVADPGPTPGGLDPAVQQDTATIAICHNIYSYLFRVDAHLIPYPDLATSYTTSKDGLTWTISLRKGVKFHSGKDFSADDVIYSLNRIKTLKQGWATTLANVSKMTKNDPYTVVFHLSAPTPDLPSFLADYHMCILENNFDPTMKPGYEKLTTAPSGTGPFKLKDFIPADHATLVRNPNYFEQPYPYLDAIKFVYLPQPTTQIAALQSGQVDFIVQLSPVQAQALASSSNIKSPTMAATGFQNMRMRADRPPFNDPRVRSAFKYIIDRKAIINLTSAGLAPIGNDQPISPAFSRWYSNIGVKSPDFAKATALLSAAGYTKDKPLTVNLYASNAQGMLDVATAFQQMATNVTNVNVKIVSETLNTYYAADWLETDFGITPWGARGTPQEYLTLLYRTGAVWNEGHYFNKKLDALIDAAGSELDMHKRKSLYTQIAQIISDDGPSIIPEYSVNAFPYSTKVQGFTPAPDTFHFYKTAWLSS